MQTISRNILEEKWKLDQPVVHHPTSASKVLHLARSYISTALYPYYEKLMDYDLIDGESFERIFRYTETTADGGSQKKWQALK